MGIADFIKDKAQQNLKSEAVTLRLPATTVGELDDLASSLNVTRQDLLAELVSSALEEALRIYDKEQNLPSPDEGIAAAVGQDPCFFMLNTNKRHDPADHFYMVNNGVAQAFYDPWKFNIKRLRKGDVVFLYESGVGIVGVGRANGQLEILDKNGDVDETYQQKLIDYRKVGPFTARDIKKLIGGNMVFLKTMFKVPSNWGEAIEQQLK